MADTEEEKETGTWKLKTGLAQMLKGGYRALHWAAKFGETEIVKILLEHGANPEVTTTEGHSYTPLKLQMKWHTIIARMLTEAVEARSQNFSGSNGRPPIMPPPLSTKTLPYKSLDMASSGASSPITAPTAVPADKTGAITTPNFKAAPDQNAVAIVIGIESIRPCLLQDLCAVMPA